MSIECAKGMNACYNTEFHIVNGSVTCVTLLHTNEWYGCREPNFEAASSMYCVIASKHTRCDVCVCACCTIVRMRFGERKKSVGKRQSLRIEPMWVCVCVWALSRILCRLVGVGFSLTQPFSSFKGTAPTKCFRWRMRISDIQHIKFESRKIYFILHIRSTIPFSLTFDRVF